MFKPNKKKSGKGKSMKDMAVKKASPFTKSFSNSSSCKGKYKVHADSPDQ